MNKSLLLNRLWHRLLDDPTGQYKNYRSKLNTYYGIKRIMRCFDTAESKRNISFLPSNSTYGHEYWLRTYSGWEKPVYGEIEHGLYLGRNKIKVGFGISYELKKILTFGDYRYEVLREAFPDYEIIKIGPRIAYASTDEKYKEELLRQANGERVATLFPGHSNASMRSTYDVGAYLETAKQVAAKYGINKIRVSLREFDINNPNYEIYKKLGVDIVSAGENPISFLPRLRAILETSALTIANSVGTNLGYSIYLNVPQILIPQEIVILDVNGQKTEDANSAHTNSFFFEECKTFEKVFSPDCGLGITEEQYKLCNYYWGIEDVRSKESMYNLLKSLYEDYRKQGR